MNERDDYQHLIRKKKLSLRIKEWFRRLLRSINQKGQQVQTIMFVPHDEKKIFNFHISNYTIFLVALIFAGIIALAVYSILRSGDAVGNLNEYRAETREARTVLRQYKDAVNRLERQVDAYNASLASIAKISGVEAAPVEIDKSKLDVPHSVINEYSYPDEGVTLRELNERLEISRAELSKIEQFESVRKDLVDAIPSIWPVKSGQGRITSSYGVRRAPFTQKLSFHTGIDIASISGTPIVATADGEVLTAENRSAYGNMVTIQHRYGYRTIYAHNSELLVRPGQKVKRGQTIALMGKTGRATGTHVHYEVRLANERVDPLPYISTTF